MSNKPIICLDFDGCIHLYSKGWQDGSIYDNVVPGFFNWAERAKTHFRLVVYSSRSKTDAGIAAMTEWMGEQFEDWAATAGALTLTFDDFEFAYEKPPAFLTIDDRGMQFRGDWSAWWLQPARLKEFKPWNVDDEGGRCALAALHPDFVALVNANRIICQLTRGETVTGMDEHVAYMRKVTSGNSQT